MLPPPDPTGLTPAVIADLGLDPNTVIADYESWLNFRANQLHPPQVDPAGLDRQDLVQEGRIAMWTALGTFDPQKGSLPAWLTFRATGRMKNLLRLAPTKHAHGRNVPMELLTEEEADTLLQAEDTWDLVVRAYHAGQVLQALNCLTPRQREYVHFRFWRQATQQEMREHFGYDPGALWTSARNGARGKLQRELVHLRPAA